MATVMLGSEKMHWNCSDPNLASKVSAWQLTSGSEAQRYHGEISVYLGRK
jgi:hypothetical protein